MNMDKIEGRHNCLSFPLIPVTQILQDDKVKIETFSVQWTEDIGLFDYTKR